MTDEQINAAIAEACGWENVTAAHRSGRAPGADYVGSEFIPDYCADLNAMHEAEKTLSTANMYVMEVQIKRVLKAREFYFHATARQRAEAFLRTLGKWEGWK
jgi:hypothetical protein